MTDTAARPALLEQMVQAQPEHVRVRWTQAQIAVQAAQVGFAGNDKEVRAMRQAKLDYMQGKPPKGMFDCAE